MNIYLFLMLFFYAQLNAMKHVFNCEKIDFSNGVYSLKFHKLAEEASQRYIELLDQVVIIPPQGAFPACSESQPGYFKKLTIDNQNSKESISLVVGIHFIRVCNSKVSIKNNTSIECLRLKVSENGSLILKNLASGGPSWITALNESNCHVNRLKDHVLLYLQVDINGSGNFSANDITLKQGCFTLFSADTQLCLNTIMWINAKQYALEKEAYKGDVTHIKKSYIALASAKYKECYFSSIPYEIRELIFSFIKPQHRFNNTKLWKDALIDELCLKDENTLTIEASSKKNPIEPKLEPIILDGIVMPCLKLKAFDCPLDLSNILVHTLIIESCRMPIIVSGCAERVIINDGKDMIDVTGLTYGEKYS